MKEKEIENKPIGNPQSAIRNLRKSLFLKLFLWFWLAMALVGLAAIIATLSTQSEPVLAQWRLVAEETMTIYSRTATDIYTKDGKQALQTYIQKMNEVSNVKASFFDINGNQIAGELQDKTLQLLVQRALFSNTIEVEFTGRVAIVAKRVTGDKGDYVLVAEMVRPRAAPFLASPKTRLLRITAIILTAGLVCYAFARYLTSPITKLRSATKKLTEGELSTRVGLAIGNRRDEIGELGKDFDEMADKIESLVKNQKRLISDISHELRSPLARLSVALELARKYVGDDAKTHLERIEKESNTLNDMIGQLLALSRLENEAVETKSEDFDLADIVKEVVSDTDFEAKGKNRSVNLLECESALIKGNRNLIRSAVENVVRNGLRHTHENSSVDVVLKVENKMALCTIRDYGEGVPEHLLKELFKPFFRVTDARERQTGGAGLGLAITERAVKFHDGNVEAKNAEQGLIVEIKIPLTVS